MQLLTKLPLASEIIYIALYFVDTFFNVNTESSNIRKADILVNSKLFVGQEQMMVKSTPQPL